MDYKSHSHSYQKILDVREKETEQARVQMANALHKQDSVHQKITQTQQSLDDLQSNLEQKKHEGISIRELQLIEDQMTMLRLRMKREQNELRMAEKNVNHKQNSLSSRKQEEKKWGHLVEQKKNEQAEWENTREQRHMDDVAAQFFQRSSSVW